MITAVSKGSVKDAKKILENQGKEHRRKHDIINAKSVRGVSLLHKASSEGDIQMVKWLLKNGANKKILNKIIFIHYSGKSKPWSVKGAIHPSSNFYHINYYELFKKRYHIANNWKMLALTDFIMLIKNGEIKRVQYKASYVINVLRYLFS